MAFSVTALNLVNRVRRRRRLDDVGSIAKVEDLAALDSINNAIEEVLSSQRWEFDLRRDQITLRARLEGLTTTNSLGAMSSFSTTLSTGLVQADLNGDYITRLVVTGSEDYPATALRVLYASAVLGGVTSTLVAATEIDEHVVAVDAEFFYAEYILPETVRDVVRVTHQERPITLEQVDPIVEFDELYPRPGIEYGQPETVSIGGLDVPTYLSTAGEGDAGLRMIVWPVPDDEYVLDYTYYYRHPELVSATDTLDGVPQNVVAKIVDIAAVQMKAFYEKDYNSLVLASDARRSLNDMHNRSKGQSADRKVVGNWEGVGGRHMRYGGLTGGRLIGGG